MSGERIVGREAEMSEVKAYRDMERRFNALEGDISDIDGVTDPEAKKRRIRWAWEACQDLADALETLEAAVGADSVTPTR